jgi:hypothetical protein
MFYYNFFFAVLTFQIIFYITTELDLFLDDLPAFDHNVLWIMFAFTQTLYRLKDLNVGSTSEIRINTLSFEEENIISRIDKPPRPKTRNYYPRPSFADVQFEERNSFIGDSYSGDCIIEWNIDGASEQHILNIIQNMTMAATAFKIKKNSDKKTKDMLVMGFTGQLKGWWDNILSDEDKLSI